MKHSNIFIKFLYSIFFFFFLIPLYSESRCQKGSGKDLYGNIVVISIFADDINTCWSSDRVDAYTISTKKYMDIATKWIRKSVKKYNANPNFIYDFFKYGGIYYKTKFNIDMTDWRKNDQEVWNYINTKIDLNWIKKNYETDNLFFMVYLNTPKANPAAPSTRSYYERMPYPYEIIYLYRYRDFWETPPASYAHEILHIFGAKDLYYADERNGFSESFVDFCKTEYKNDIMRTISDVKKGGVHYDKITNELSDIDAYYLGLTHAPKEIRSFNLPKSEHQEHLK